MTILGSRKQGAAAASISMAVLLVTCLSFLTVASGCTIAGGGSIGTEAVTYDGNAADGGSVPTDSTAYTEGQTVTVPGNPGDLVKAGYSFIGWNTQADGAGTHYTQGQTFAMGPADITLYAKWTTNPTYAVAYDGNGNTGGSVPVDSTAYTEGQTATVLGNTGILVKTGYSFEGWDTQADGNGTTCSPGQTFAMGAVSVTLYAKWMTAYALRDIGPAGGWIFYDKESYSGGWRYLEAAPSDQSAGIAWNDGSFTWTTTGATGTATGTGQANTAAIVASQGTGSYAAQLCNDLTVGSYSDWFLPSIDELDQMRANLYPSFGGFPQPGEFYWSSSEDSDSHAFPEWFYDGMRNVSYYKSTSSIHVRAVRAF